MAWGWLFRHQFWALFVKNWIVISKHPILNTLRCLLVPVAYSVFLAEAQNFLAKPNNFGIGDPIAVYSLKDTFNPSLALVWADGTDGTGLFSAQDVMNHITSGFSPSQLQAVVQVDAPDDIPSQCPENFKLLSPCFAGVAFNSLPSAKSGSANYTLRADGGLSFVDVIYHTGDYELRLLPLQWAIDSAIIELNTGVKPQTPLEWPFTQETNEEQTQHTRAEYVSALDTILSLAFFVCLLGIAYQLPGSFMGERANLLTSHLQAMGLLNSARIISWHVSISLAYLPAWIAVSFVWKHELFVLSSIWLILGINILTGLSLASWSFFIATPFEKSPQLAAVASTFICILFAILGESFFFPTEIAVAFILLFPSSFFCFAIRVVGDYDSSQLSTNAFESDPKHGVLLWPLMVAALINVFLWPWLAVLWERRLYDARDIPEKPQARTYHYLKRQKKSSVEDLLPPAPSDTCISIRNVNMTFRKAWWQVGSRDVIAISDLSLDIPKTGIFVLLGSNGAGKSTLLSILANLLGRTGGSVTFEGGASRPPRSTIGIVPQKNVLFPELTCYQTLKVWKAIKRQKDATEEDDIVQLLRDCDLENKIHANADALSGGQKRKLQLAIGLIGGSKIVLVDEATSGVDPLSRRALWRTLTGVRNERTIIFTTHFLDEADLLADRVAILAAPGKLVAQGTPVYLKSSLGEGYTVQITLPSVEFTEKFLQTTLRPLMESIQTVAPYAYLSSWNAPVASYHLSAKDTLTVERVLNLIETQQESLGIASYDVHGSSMEDIFLELMRQQGMNNGNAPYPLLEEEEDYFIGDGFDSASDLDLDKHAAKQEQQQLVLTNSRRRSPLSQAFTIVHKRFIIASRSWLSPVLTIIIAVCGVCMPILFLNRRPPTCVSTNAYSYVNYLYLPGQSFLFAGDSGLDLVLTSPPGIAQTLGSPAAGFRTTNIPNNATFVQTIQDNYQNPDLAYGGVSFDLTTGNSLLAYTASPPGYNGLLMLNLASNILYTHALNETHQRASEPAVLSAYYSRFPTLDAGTLDALKWAFLSGATMAVYPAFFALYVSLERRTSVQAMQLSNGLANPAGLWLGHLMFDTIIGTIVSVVIIVVFTQISNQFHGPVLLWFVFFLYGIAGALFAYCATLFINSPLAAFGLVAGYQFLVFLLYVAGYLLTLTFATTTEDTHFLNIINFTLSLIAPVGSILRATWIAVNLFSLLCNGDQEVTTASLHDIERYGGPILYLIVMSFFLFGVLVWYDSGAKIPRILRLSSLRRSNRRTAGRPDSQAEKLFMTEVGSEAAAVENSEDPLRVLHVAKTFGNSETKAVDDVTFGVSQDTVLALLGPNGAGKTSTFNIIRGDIKPDEGDVFIQGTSVTEHTRTARLSLGVCPQFTAIDTQLTVREHLMLYGRLKGLRRGKELNENVEALMHATTLSPYADRLASKLSGGNQRKLSLAIALLGNPSVILIDEFSTGIDAKTKRDMWTTLKNVAHGKAIVITTHSMEEASALADKLVIVASRLLAVGSVESLEARYPIYEIHFSCRTREEVTRAQELMARIPGARLSEDVATRFEVPLQSEDNTRSLAGLFKTLSEYGDFTDYTVERVSLETVFLKVIRENNVKEEDHRHKQRKWWRTC